MSSDFLIWQFRRDLISLDSYFFPNDWICRRDDMNFNPRSICGKTIWLVIADNRNLFLYGHLVVEKIEYIEHGENYVMTADCRVSFRLLPRKEDDWSDWEIPWKYFFLGLRISNDSFFNNIRLMLKNNMKTPLAFAKKKNAKEKIKPASLVDVEKFYLQALGEYCYGDLEWENDDTITPYAALFSFENNGQFSQENKKHLLEMDSQILHILQKNFAKGIYSRGMISVDTLLRPAKETDMRPRKFIDGGDHSISMVTTQMAENEHQKIVRDLFCFFDNCNIEPLFSRSVDLAVKIEEHRLFIFEVKSANIKNFDSQMRSGIIQILEYKMWMMREKTLQVLPILVISSISSDTKEEYVKNFADSVGVASIFYNSQGNIESRFPFLADIVKKANQQYIVKK